MWQKEQSIQATKKILVDLQQLATGRSLEDLDETTKISEESIIKCASNFEPVLMTCVDLKRRPTAVELEKYR